MLGGLATLATAYYGPEAGLNVLVAVSTAAALDLGFTYVRTGRVEVPDGAVITGLIIALVLRVEEPLVVVAATAVLAISSKHALRSRWSNILNPAAFGLVVSALLFGSGQSWWGSLPDIGWPSAVLLAMACLYLSDHLNKLVVLMVFASVYLGLFGLASLTAGADDVAEVFRQPDLHMLLFFSAFMLTDPPTSPVRYTHQAAFGAVTAISSVLLFFLAGGVYFLAGGLLIANAVESLRRAVTQRPRPGALSPDAVKEKGIEI